MSDIFIQAMNRIKLFRADAETAKLVQTISQVTGISQSSIAMAERSAIAQRSFRPLRHLLENHHTSKVNKLRYRIGFKQARKRSQRVGEILANKIELTITTERGVVHCEADIYVACHTVGSAEQQTIQIDIRYTLYTGFKKQQFRQNLKLSSRPKQNWAPQWSMAA